MRSVLPASVVYLIPATAYAHSFATPYALPVPFWMYAYGCAATLILTFAMVAFFWEGATNASRVGPWMWVPTRHMATAVRWGLGVLRAAALGALVLVIVAGFAGTGDPERNINMTLFWILFLLGFTYLTLVVGNLYALINPWKTIVESLQCVGVDVSRRRITYSHAVGYWPALSFYVILMWIELFVLPRPLTLSLVLMTYTMITISGVLLIGKETWFDRCDCFSVLFRLVAILSPVEYIRSPEDMAVGIRLRLPCTGALMERPEHISLVLFILFILSSTTYDAIYQTVLWASLYWRPLLALLEPLWGTDLAQAQRILMGGYIAYQRGGLILSPVFYVALYLLILWWARASTGSRITLGTMTLNFAYSLIPIAVAYHFTHYYSLLFAQGRNVWGLISDPLGRGWNLLGLLSVDSETPPLRMAVIWHTQIAVLLIGHVISVYLAHRVAVRMFATRREIIVSQLPLLLLMIAYTVIGLWILSLPLAV